MAWPPQEGRISKRGLLGARAPQGKAPSPLEATPDALPRKV